MKTQEKERKPRRILIPVDREQITGKYKDGPGMYLTFQTDHATNDAVFKITFHRKVGKLLIKSQPSVSFTLDQAEILSERLDDMITRAKVMGCGVIDYSVSEPAVLP